MDLILWRHAEAEEAREDQADVDRRLTPRGEKQAARMAGWLERGQRNPTAISLWLLAQSVDAMPADLVQPVPD